MNKKYKIKFTNTFKKKYKKIKNNPKFKQEEFIEVVNILINNSIWPLKYKNHLLRPKSNEIWECHIQNDILLEYKKQKENSIIIFVDIGTHSELFKD